MINPKIKLRDYTNWWKYWFRVVHTHYFSYETLGQVLHKAGFKDKDYGLQNEEVWTLLINNCNVYNSNKQLDPKLYYRKMDILNKLLP